MNPNVFGEAAKKVSERGLWKAGSPDFLPGTCALLAIYDSGGQETPYFKTFLEANNIPYDDSFGESEDENVRHTIVRWNDAPERTKADVVVALYRAATYSRLVSSNE